MITRIQLKNYRHIPELDLELGRLNVLIGRNAAGKSSLLQFLRLLREGARGNLSAAISELGGFNQIKPYGASARDETTWELELSGIEADSPIYSNGVLASRGGAGYSVKLEEVERPPYPGHTARYKYLSVVEGRVRILKARRLPGDSVNGALNGDAQYADEPASDESDQELYLAQAGNRLRYPSLHALRAMLRDWALFSGFGSEALQVVRTAQVFNVAPPLRLDPSGANLVSIVQQLANDPQYDATNQQLALAMRAVFDDFVKLDTPITAGGAGGLTYRSKWHNVAVPAISMSDGQLRFLGLLLLLLLPDPPALIMLDEPEIGMHPEMLAVLGEVIQDAAERTQIIIATHSPQLLNHLGAENVILVDRDEGGKARFERPDVARLSLWLERYDLGRLWTMGKLGV
jgi:predicted ATPase